MIQVGGRKLEYAQHSPDHRQRGCQLLLVVGSQDSLARVVQPLRVGVGHHGAGVVSHKRGQGYRSGVRGQRLDLCEHFLHGLAVEHCGLQTVFRILADVLQSAPHHLEQI